MERSRSLFQRARALIPGGVNSPVRACRHVGCEPLFIASGKGGRITDVDGQEYVDLVMSWGPLLLGHAHPEVTRAAHEALDRGSSYGAPCEAEVDLAQAVVDALPGVDMVRMVNSGTEAAMSALRLARGFTGRAKVIKFAGCYHGHADAFLIKAGSGVKTQAIPGNPGVPQGTVRDTLIAAYNNLGDVRDHFARHAEDIAAVIVEPMAGNMGLVAPAPGFLQGLRELCDAHGALFILDEVITGFRLAYGGAQSRWGVIPDLTVLGKIIGGGFPVGAYGGRRDIMELVAPSGGIYQAGTLSGNPVAMAAGLATLKILARSDYDGLETRTSALARELGDILRAKGAAVTVNTLASMFTIFFTPGPVTDEASADTADTAKFAAFYRGMRERGVYLAPSGFECAMCSFAHTDEDFARVLEAARKVAL